MTLGKPIRARGHVVGGVEMDRGDALFEMHGKQVLCGTRQGRHFVSWDDDKGVPLQWTTADKAHADRVAIFVATYRALPPSAMRRRARTLAGLPAVSI